MNGLLPLWTLLVATPYHAVSKPTIQAWARYKDKFRMPRVGRMLAFANSEFGGVGGAKTPTRSEELREEAAAKYKEVVEKASEYSGISIDDDNQVSEAQLSEMWEKMNDEQRQAVETIQAEANRLKDDYEAAAKAEGIQLDIRESMSFFHGKATGRPINWDAYRPYGTIEPRKTLGQRFVESESFQALLKTGGLRGDSVNVDTGRMTAAGPLGEVEEVFEKARRGDDEAQKEAIGILREMKAASDLIYSGTAGEGADAFVQNMLIPGYIGMPQRPLTIRELFSQGTTISDTIEYVQQTNFDSGADTVAEPTATDEGAKPQSSIAFEVVTKPVETVATYMAATRRQLADVAQLQSIIDEQGRLMIQIAEEDQLVSGTGASPDLQGFTGATGVQTFDVAAGATDAISQLNNLKAIRIARTMVATGAQRGRAEAIILNPNDAEEIDLMVDDNGQFRGGNPIGNFTFDQTIWRLRRVESEAITEGEAYVGMFSLAASVLQRMPITVFTADQHSDWFLRNIIAILFEERIGFPIYRPSLIVKINFADWGESAIGS